MNDPALKSVPAALLLAASVLFCIYYGFTQEQILYKGALGFDASFYGKMTAQFANGEPLATEAPFIYRPALPALVALTFPDDTVAGFRLWNLLFSAVNLCLLVLLLRCVSKCWWRIGLLLLLFIWNPLSPFRFVHFFPVFVDNAALTPILLMLYWGLRHPELNWRNMLIHSALCFVGVFFREIVVVPAIALCCQHVVACWQQRGVPPMVQFRALALAAMPAIAGFVAMILTRSLPADIIGNYTFLSHAREVLLWHLHHPATLALTLLTAFGFVLAIVLAQPKQTWQVCRQYPLIGFYILGFFLLSLFAGYNTERLVFWSYPGVFVLLLAVWDQRPRLQPDPWQLVFCAVLVVASCLLFRALWSIPIGDDQPLYAEGLPRAIALLTPHGSHVNLGLCVYADAGHAGGATLVSSIVLVMAILVLIYRVPLNQCSRRAHRSVGYGSHSVARLQDRGLK